ncbi:MAG: isoleucine--tRNA ligase [Candidatus Woesearchaeota archaeon]|nr:MAG: isoleucine--tRNA ligase [Candidatus Woesearchaeota archaeon]
MYNFKQIEQEVLQFWKKIDLLSKLLKKNKGNKPYFFLDGPPYANDIPHVGHIKNTLVKDLNIRLAFMKGYDVLFQPGFDTHGLPVENKVEKKLNLKSKKDIEKLGIKKFTDICKASAADNKDLWMEVYDKLGSWYSWKTPYLTYDNSYLESAWWSFKQIWDKGIVYEGKKPVFWCPKCETALAGYEVTDSYAMQKDPYILIKFKVKNTKNDYLLVFTTTPWTLISNVAIAAHPDADYVKVETLSGNLILAKDRLEVLEQQLEMGYKIIDEFKGKKLDGLKYEPILDVPIQHELSKNPKAHKVYMSIQILKERVPAKLRTKKGFTGEDIFEDFVTTKDGTGLVHAAPGHGKTDNEVGKYYQLPDPSPLDDSCKYTDEAGQFKGMFVKHADEHILELLKKTGNLLFSSKVEHKYPLCWRCKSPLIFRMSNQWFIKIESIKEKMLEENKKIKWYPEFARERFDSWILNAEDWNVSRQRYWGIPMPIWKCSCGDVKVIGSLEELEKNASKKLPKNFDLHTTSEIKLKCKECKKEMNKVNDIFDVWFDSGVAPFASLHYPFENKKLFEDHYPVSRINEAQDQIRGWFYSLMFCGVATFGKAPYKEVSMPGWVVDSKGEKMSKSIGNVIYAKEAIEEVGGDNLRFYYMWDIAPYELQMFNKETIKKEVWRIFNVLVNSSTYLLSLSDKISKVKLKKQEDLWVISKLNTLIKNYNENIDKFEYHTAARELADFILNTLSRTYIHIIRERSKDPKVAYVIYEALSKIILLLAPVTPFLSEHLYQELKKKYKLKEESIHLIDWPKHNEKLIDKDLESHFSIIQPIIQEILSQREKIQMGVRWPLAKVTIKTSDKKVEAAVKSLSSIIETQTNVKKVEATEDKEKLLVVLDSKLTKELEQEGFTREVMRKIQEMRKKAGLKPEDKIELLISSSYDLSEFKKEIMEKVGAKTLEFSLNKKKYTNSSKEKVKDKVFEIAFNKL